MEKKAITLCFVTALLVCTLLVPMSSWSQIPFKLQTEIPPARSIWIGILRGTWTEMGIQYGQRCGEDIARNFDAWWRIEIVNVTRGWAEGRTLQEKEEYCVKYIERSLKELYYLSPKMVEFFDGIAQGAAPQLDNCINAAKCSHLVKIAALNFSNSHFHPNWDFVKDAPVAMARTKMYAKADKDDHDCNAYWVRAGATRDGETYTTRSAQTGIIYTGGSHQIRQVAYHAIPKDGSARSFWGFSYAGNIGGLGGGVMNDLGLCVLTAGAQYDEANAIPDETMAPGVKDFWLASYGVIFSKTPEEAAERVTVGTHQYRKATGRKTVLRVRGANIVFANAKRAICVEQNARHYAIRKPGYLGEERGNYLVIANHFKYEDGSFDENNVFHSDQPMTMFCPEKVGDSSYYRFWSGMWMIKNNYGQIDKDMVMRDHVAAHYAYDKDGNRYDVDADGAPTVPGTFCSHGRTRTVENPLSTSGDSSTSVLRPSTLEAWWVPLWPCHYKEWNLSWDYHNLNGFGGHWVWPKK